MIMSERKWINNYVYMLGDTTFYFIQMNAAIGKCVPEIIFSFNMLRKIGVNLMNVALFNFSVFMT